MFFSKAINSLLIQCAHAAKRGRFFPSISPDPDRRRFVPHRKVIFKNNWR